MVFISEFEVRVILTSFCLVPEGARLGEQFPSKRLVRVSLTKITRPWGVEPMKAKRLPEGEIATWSMSGSLA